MATRLSTNFKTRTNVIDNITPNCIYNSDFLRGPAGQFKPAPWLPTQWTSAVDQDAFVISKGKLVALTRDGYVVPAGLRAALAVTSGDVLAYTATDVLHGVIDITTGAVCVAGVGYTGDEISQALVGQGLVREDDGGSGSLNEATVIPLYISAPVGIAAYDIYVRAGDAPEAAFQTNYQKQGLIAFFTNAQMIVPVMSPEAITTDVFDVSVLTTTTYNAATAPFPDTGEYWDATNISQVLRYADALDATSPVVAIGLAQLHVAAETSRTPITSDVATVLVRSRTSADRITTAGDYFLDADVGVLFLHEDTWAAIVLADTDPTFTYYGYQGADGDAAAHRYVHLIPNAQGIVQPGGYVKCDVDSNFLCFTPTDAAGILSVVGRVTQVIEDPRSMLDSVKTAWNHTGAAKDAQMPGSATLGYGDLITMTDEIVANKLAIVTVATFGM